MHYYQCSEGCLYTDEKDLWAQFHECCPICDVFFCGLDCDTCGGGCEPFELTEEEYNQKKAKLQ
jgi:hypothetical protein